MERRNLIRDDESWFKDETEEYVDSEDDCSIVYDGSMNNLEEEEGRITHLRGCTLKGFFDGGGGGDLLYINQNLVMTPP